ncbi:MAG: exo-alpha-sialidase [Lentisphaerae bacterium]|jgi:hypothetical protein|nr:exo-alpha-sialidase [Lentisphaerota bacterium]MBT4818985.1 exo-alpha-sialidase [Lentisphaerota bacterium]MBT5612176.1 exo-alpha-sialidase [Lentisphaerota bacterium]MBT7061103.1 exo-alpha-sialidase [Lentisphaerota bacterium]MBT7843432.1 exo-alpha-sialidase [Lentisphaerota bacterium]
MPPLDVSIDDPVLVALSAPGEQRWGFHQFPALSRMPDGRILLMYADAADASETHGHPAPGYVSDDEGQSWSFLSEELRPVRPHFSISEVYDGEFLVMPACEYLNIDAMGVELPEPVAEACVYGTLFHYRCSDMPKPVQDYFRHIPGKRWAPGSGTWQDTIVEYDIRKLLPWRRADSRVLPRTYFEHPLLRWHGELLYPDYRARYVQDNGQIIGHGSTSLMVSTDNGQSFQRRSTLAADLSDRDLMGEPALSATADGNLVCVVRRTDQTQKPMCITWSEDGGNTWEPIQDLFDFGVFPGVLLLGNGVLVVSYGRPGVHLAFDANGAGKSWDHHETLIAGDHAAVSQHTCGYTSLLALDDDSFLIAYSDFQHNDPDGQQHKAILTQRISF